MDVRHPVVARDDRPARRGRQYRRRLRPTVRSRYRRRDHGREEVRPARLARLLDHMLVVVVPSLPGRGVRLWDGLEGLEKHYEVEATSSPSGVTHVTFTRSGA